MPILRVAARYAGPAESYHGAGIESPARTVGMTLVLVAGILAGTAPALAGHPLDPLTRDEIRAAVRALKTHGQADEATLYHTIVLDPPPKGAMLGWTPGEALDRRAFIVARRGPRTFEGRVDLATGAVLSWTERQGVQPALLPSEEAEAALRIVYADADWRVAVDQRGVSDLAKVTCTPLAAGGAAAGEKRLVNVICYDGSTGAPFWGRPIEGLMAVVDLNAHRVVRLVDKRTAPLPPATAAFPAAEERTASPRSPDRASEASSRIHIDGHTVRWNGWQFHYRHDPRVGTIVSMATIERNGRRRSVLYEGSLSEIFVPYMDPDEVWSFRTFLDAGENDLGKLAVSLSPGLDCPEGAVFMDAVMADDWGEPVTRPRAMCLFERSVTDVAWRHSESVTGPSRVQPRTDLVLRQVATLANYDYIFDWIFRQDGSLAVAVGATGVMQVKAISPGDEAAARYGQLLDPHTVAVNHDHFFAFRLDVDVDGPANSFVIDRLRRRDVPDVDGRRGFWVVEHDVARRESQAQLHAGMGDPALWRVINPARRDGVGNASSYQLSPGHEAISLLAPDDPVQQRAAFTKYTLWVTPYAPGERYAAGDYPNQSAGGDGLPRWTSADRSIETTDIVLWYTLGFHHVPRLEDWPIVPTMWHRFELRPFNFFEPGEAVSTGG